MYEKTRITISEQYIWSALLPNNLSASQKLLAFPLDILGVCMHKQLSTTAIKKECTVAKWCI